MNPQQEKQQYLETIKNHTDRELLELQTFYAAKTQQQTKATNGAIQVIYWIFIISAVLMVIAIINDFSKI